MRVCAEPGCPELTDATRCPAHRRKQRQVEDARRGNWRQRGYDAEYERNRKRCIAEETSCWLCGEPVDKLLAGTDPYGPTADHVVPREHGGSNQRSNLRLAHKICNDRRRDGVGGDH